MTSAAPNLILASASSARARLLEQAGVEFTRRPAEIDEGEIKRELQTGDVDPATVAGTLAETKARSVADRNRGAAVLGADQMLVCDGMWLDKPRDRDQARAQLRFLRGRTHRLISAACVLRDDHILWRDTEVADMTVRSFSDGFLDAYLDNCGPEILESVGAYRLEGTGIQLFSRIDGTYFAVLGLPLLSLLDFLRSTGLLRS